MDYKTIARTRRWTGYESVKYYWHNKSAELLLTPGNGILYKEHLPDGYPSVYIVWAKDDKQLRQLTAPWLRWLPCWLLWRLRIWLLTR
jgi:hypothetical protein